MAGTEYKEQCSCGAAMELSRADMSMAALTAVILKFREEHRHELPAARGISTNAKGYFGFAGYAQRQYDGSDEEDDDDD